MNARDLFFKPPENYSKRMKTTKSFFSVKSFFGNEEINLILAELWFKFLGGLD